jgi:hypothetical protein
MKVKINYKFLSKEKIESLFQEFVQQKNTIKIKDLYNQINKKNQSFLKELILAEIQLSEPIKHKILNQNNINIDYRFLLEIDRSFF